MKIRIIKILSFLFNKGGLWKFRPFLLLAYKFNNIVAKPVYLTVFGKKLFIHLKNDHLSNSLYYYAKYEPFETNLFQKLIKTGDSVLDIGAHIGYYTLLASELVGKSGKVFSFEPDTNNLTLLRKNVAVNKLTNVVIVNKAVSNEQKEIKFYRASYNKGDNRMFRENNNEDCIKVKCVTLDKYFAKSNFPIDFVKMDIQGAEVKALQGMSRILQDNKDIILVFEFWPYGYFYSGSRVKDLLDLLKMNKFVLYDIGANETVNKLKIVSGEFLLKYYHSNDLNDMTNILCIRNNSRIKLLL